MVQKVLVRLAGVTQQLTPNTSSAGAADAGKLVALDNTGKIDSTMIPTAAGNSRAVPASEALAAGAFVNLFSNAGALGVRNADNSNNRPANGYVTAAVASGAQATVYDIDGINSGLTGLTIGTTYYLGTGGGTIATPLDATSAATGLIDQRLGIAVSATELKTDDYGYVVL